MTQESGILALRLLSRIAESCARQEYFISSVVDAAHLAIEQVQDKRLESVRSGPKVTAGDFFTDIVIGIALGPVAQRVLKVAWSGTRVKCGPLTPNQKPGARMRLVKTGWLCHYCGFTPNQRFLRIQHAVRHVRGE